ncbi:WecB/TagA/CpsF family glycosyltransferase [Aeoliella mucimassa]|uniref:UDP-N-acetyl-D-mannosaminuronic acid transferase n=1 Tax=Aeoliella mucimassa TaxID=2527972 RepID=A0A518AMY6_9BACT|nr:WecB/TagA/CpsF family glycosyltransferase [Aeoliella mucimassa]QDU56083.1 UDP-N-acetyl-D-mannosaminuronic acid transferase [Aeoliella mucimassa]
MIDRGKHNVLGVKINAVDYDAAVTRIIDAARAAKPMAISALAVHGLMTGVLDREHRYRLNHFELIVPDGHPVRWALNWLHGTKLPDRVYGPNLMLEVCRSAAETGVPIFLFGGTEELLADLQHRLLKQFPKLQIAGVRASKFRTLNEQERQELVDEIRQSGAKLAFVGLGCPRQEVFSHEMKGRVSMPLLAVGAAFNFHAGQLAQAPKWMQDRGLEWLFRLWKEPRRLWRRYLYLNPLYLTLLGLQLTGIYRLNPDSTQQPATEICYG